MTRKAFKSFKNFYNKWDTFAGCITLTAIVFFMIFGFIFLIRTNIHFATAIYKAYVESPNWPGTHGKISSSEVVRGCGRGSSYFLKITYDYSVNNMNYKGSRITFGNGYCSGRKNVENEAAYYAVGSKVSVYYDPTAHSEAILYRGETNNGTIFLAPFIFIITIIYLNYLKNFVVGILIDSKSNAEQPDLEALLVRRSVLDNSIRIEAVKQNDHKHDK